MDAVRFPFAPRVKKDGPGSLIRASGADCFSGCRGARSGVDFGRFLSEFTALEGAVGKGVPAAPD
jgi:hypothetical protein